MDDKARFDQLENLLVDLARKQDRQSEQIAKIFDVLAQHGESIARLEVAFARQEVRLDNVSEQIDDVINILKISAARHIEAEQRQDAIMTEIREQGQRLDAQSKRQDVAVDALRALLKRQETTDTRLDSAVQTQLQMLQLMQFNATKTDAQEPRLTRLEGEVFRAAS